MKDENKTKAQLIEELNELRQQVGEPGKQIQFQNDLLNAVGQAVIATDLQGEIIYLNRLAEQLYGWSAEDALGRNIMEVTVPQISQQQAEEIMMTLKKGASWSGEFFVHRKDGTVFPALVTDTPIHDASGNLIGIIGVSSDITARKQDEEKLWQSEEKYRGLVEGLTKLYIAWLCPMGSMNTSALPSKKYLVTERKNGSPNRC